MLEQGPRSITSGRPVPTKKRDVGGMTLRGLGREMCELLRYEVRQSKGAVGYACIPTDSVGWLHSCVRAVITKYHQLGALYNVNIFSRSSGGQKFKMKVLQGRFPPRPLSLARRRLVFFLRLHMKVQPHCITGRLD